MEKVRANLMLCAGTGCVASGTMKVKAALQEELKKRGLEEEIKLVLTGCNGYCAEGPVMVVHPDEIFYQKAHCRRDTHTGRRTFPQGQALPEADVQGA